MFSSINKLSYFNIHTHFGIIAMSQQQEIARLESELNCIKRERELLENDWERRRRDLLDQVKRSISTQTTLDLVNQISQLSNEYTRNKNILEMKLCETRQAYFKKLQG